MKPEGRNEIADRPVVTQDRVAARAYELYLARGQEDGHDLADWLQAEAELADAIESTPTATSDEGALRPRLARVRRSQTLGA